MNSRCSSKLKLTRANNTIPITIYLASGKIDEVKKLIRKKEII